MNYLSHYITIPMAKRIANHIHDKTPHKDRLILVGLFAVLAFTVVNTVMIAVDLSLAETAASMM